MRIKIKSKIKNLSKNLTGEFEGSIKRSGKGFEMIFLRRFAGFPTDTAMLDTGNRELVERHVT